MTMGNPIQQRLPLEESGVKNPLPPEVEEEVVLSMATLLLAVLIVEERRENDNVSRRS